MTTLHPLLQITLNDAGRLSWPVSTRHSLYCPTCLREIIKNTDGNILHKIEESFITCNTSVSVIVTKTIIELLSEGERLYVSPIKNGKKNLAPSFIFRHANKSLSPFINTDYQPVGANWRSDKGYRLALFFMDEFASSINNEQFDFIAVIDPVTFLAEFDDIWSRGTFDNPLDALRHLLVSENKSSVWVKWPVKNHVSTKQTGNSEYWDDYYSQSQATVQKVSCTADVSGIARNASGETIYTLQTSVNGSPGEYQIVNSLGFTLLLDNTGILVSETHQHFDEIIKACINGVKEFVRHNSMMLRIDRLKISVDTMSD